MANAFDFPLDLYSKSYSGLGTEAQGMLTNLLPQTQTAVEQFPEQKQQYYDQSRGDVNKGFDTAIGGLGKTYERSLQPALQQTLNDLAKRGMMDSTVASEAMSGTAKGVGESILDKQSSLELAKQMGLSNIAQQEGQGAYQYPQMLTNLLSQGRFSESGDPGQPYATALGFLQSLMG